ncbi:MAG TPA: hypothetical protein VL978_15980 [Puia sp.]|nr:hypothetical protein [Puia sp.]
MSYIIQTLDLGRPMYFMDHAGPGFSISTDPQRGKVFEGMKAAKLACKELSEISGFLCEMVRLRT